MNDPHNPKDNPTSGSARAVADIPSTMPVSRRADLAARRLLVIVGDKVSSHPLPDVGEFRVGRGEEVDLRAYPAFDPDQRYVLYCEFGLKSAHLADLMRREGLNARHVSGGMREVRKLAEKRGGA